MEIPLPNFLKKSTPPPEDTAAPKPEAEPKKTYRNTLSLVYKSGATQSVWIDEWTGTNALEPWKRFHQWWFKNATPSFWLEWRDGGCMILREDLLRFDVQVKETTKKKGKSNE